MVWILKKGATIQEIDDLKEEVSKAVDKNLGFNAFKFNGILKDSLKDIDPLEWQKEIRNKWERDFV